MQKIDNIHIKGFKKQKILSQIETLLSERPNAIPTGPRLSDHSLSKSSLSLPRRAGQRFSEISFMKNNQEITTTNTNFFHCIRDYIQENIHDEPSSQKPSSEGHSQSPAWIDIKTDDTQLLTDLGKVFGLHNLTVEDMQTSLSREKIEFFRSYVFIVLKESQFIDKVNTAGRGTGKSRAERSLERRFAKDSGQSEDFLFVVWVNNLILTVHKDESYTINRAMKKWASYRKSWSKKVDLGNSWILHKLIDTAADLLVDSNIGLELEIERLEELATHLKAEEKYGMFKRVNKVKKFILEQKRGVWPKKKIVKSIVELNVLNVLEDVPKQYFDDIRDHLVFIEQELDENHSIVDNLQAYYMGKISLEMNEISNHSADVMEVLTVITTLSMPISLLSGIWGMNMKVPGQFGEASEGNNLMAFFLMLLFMMGCIMIMWMVLKRAGVKINLVGTNTKDKRNVGRDDREKFTK